MAVLDWADSNVRLYLAMAVLFAVLSTLSVAVRFYAKRILRNLAIDDWMVLAALGFYYCQLAVHLWPLFEGGYYKHVNETTPSQLKVIMKQLTVVQFQYPIVLTLTRTSICILLLRIFILTWIKRALYVAIFLNVSWGVFVMLDALVVCRPLAFNWDHSIPGGVCGDQEAGYMANAIWGILNDVIIWSLPHFVVWKLNTTRVRKVALTLVFMLGLVDIIVSIIRITILINLRVDGDISYLLPPVQMLSFVESGVAIIVTSLMVCRPVFERFLPSKYTSTNLDALSLPLREKGSIGSDYRKAPRSPPPPPQQSPRNFSSPGPQSFFTTATATSKAATATTTHHVYRRSSSSLPEVSRNDILVTRDVSVARDVSDSVFVGSAMAESLTARHGTFYVDRWSVESAESHNR